MTVYEDSRYTYESAGLYYDGTARVTLTGDQPFDPGDMTRVATAHRTLTGTQNSVIQSLYEEAGLDYDQGGSLYQGYDMGRLIRVGSFHRVLTGNQGVPVGDLSWKFRPYVWADYTWDIGASPESTVYSTSVSQDNQVQYQHDEAHEDNPLEAEYTHRPIRPHTREGA